MSASLMQCISNITCFKKQSQNDFISDMCFSFGGSFFKVMRVKYSTDDDEMFTLQYRNMECIRGVNAIRKTVYCLNYEYV